MHANVKGGTNAGWRNPFQGNAMPWQCQCAVLIGCAGPRDERCNPEPGMCACFDGATIAKTNPGYLNRCPDCGNRRPTPQAPS